MVFTKASSLDELLLWEFEPRFVREKVTVKNSAQTAAATGASGTVTLVSPAATFVLTLEGTLLGAGQGGAITMEIDQAGSTLVTWDPDTRVLTLAVNISGGVNTVTLALAQLAADTRFAVSGTTGGAGTVTAATSGTGTLTGGYDAIVTPSVLNRGQTLVFDTSFWKPAIGNTAGAILLENLKSLSGDQSVTGVAVLRRGPALVNQEQLEYGIVNATLDTAAQRAALLALGIKCVREPLESSQQLY